LSNKLKIFYDLLKKGNEWNWSKQCDETFEKCKQELVKDTILEHFDPNKPIIVVCDASDNGLSGILCHLVENTEKPVFFASRTLNEAEKKYPILHREALALVFSLERFYKYIFGHRISIFTDHKPLLGIFGSKRGEPPVIANRLQRYALRLSIFDFELNYRTGKNNGNADCWSRLPIISNKHKEDGLEENTFEVKVVSSKSKMNLNLKIIAEETDKNEFLCQLRKYIMNGWNMNHILSHYKSYFAKNALLTVEFGCIIYNGRVVIPESLKLKVLELLHVNHNGIVVMKKISREYVYWAGIDQDIENFVTSCCSCQATRNDKPRKYFGTWAEATYPFERIHLDFVYLQNKQFLIVIDCYSRWLEIKFMKNTSAQCLIKKLKSIFRFFGPCKICVTDNGPPFGSYEFREFCSQKNIKLMHSPPYHPASNGIVERAVQSVKSVLKKLILDKNSEFKLPELINDFLENYRNTPHTKDNLIPAKLIFSFNPRNVFDSSFKNDVKNNETRVIGNKKGNVEKRKLHITKKNRYTRKLRTVGNPFSEGDDILYRYPSSGFVKWFKAKIIKKKSKHVYLICINGLQKLAHVNQLKPLVNRKKIRRISESESASESDEPLNEATELRRSKRERRKPERLQY
jgi:RNase H-like domain found in reverse transcriptase/Integrase core domain/Integrase zinc binding domain